MGDQSGSLDEIRGRRAVVLASVADQHSIRTITAGPVVSILVPSANSKIVRKNKGVAHCFRLDGLRGLFRKDRPETFEFGRHYCDLIKSTFFCDGFFTTDEIPKYGLTPEHAVYLDHHADAEPDRDVTVITLYTRLMAWEIRSRLTAELQSLLASAELHRDLHAEGGSLDVHP